MVEFMKESGMTISNMEKVIKSLAMAQSTKEVTLEENLKAMGDMNGRMESCMKGSG